MSETEQVIRKAVARAFGIIAAAATGAGGKISQQQAVDLIDGQLTVLRELLGTGSR